MQLEPMAYYALAAGSYYVNPWVMKDILATLYQDGSLSHCYSVAIPYNKDIKDVFLDQSDINDIMPK